MAANHNVQMLQGILPNWVDPDPLKSRAVDALGLQAVADRLADRLLPGLSVLTTRARYFTFLCWARQRTGRTINEQDIHRHEVALALAESSLSAMDPEGHNDCSFVGKRNIEAYKQDRGDRVPSDPRTVYKTPVWNVYRASLKRLGLVDGANGVQLTDDGEEAARLFQRSIRHRGRLNGPLSQRACLSLVSAREKRLLRNILGIAHRGPLDEDWADGRTRRAAFARAMRSFYRQDKLTPEDVLVKFAERRSSSLPEPANTLRAAAVWEHVALGLNTLFIAWVRAIDANNTRAFQKSLGRSLSARPGSAELGEIDLEVENCDAALSRALACLSKAVKLFDELPGQSSCLLDAARFELARRIVNRRVAASSRRDLALAELFQWHTFTKGDEAWLLSGNLERLGHVKMNRDTKGTWQPPKKTGLHAYRMLAFNQIAHDLGGL